MPAELQTGVQIPTGASFSEETETDGAAEGRPGAAGGPGEDRRGAAPRDLRGPPGPVQRAASVPADAGGRRVRPPAPRAARGTPGPPAGGRGRPGRVLGPGLRVRPPAGRAPVPRPPPAELPAEPRGAAGEGGPGTADPAGPRGDRRTRLLLPSAVAGAGGGHPGRGPGRAGLL